MYSLFSIRSRYEEENKNKPTRITKGISMNLEQTAGAGDYKTGYVK